MSEDIKKSRWLTDRILEQCIAEIADGTSPRSPLLNRHIIAELVKDQLDVVPALAVIISRRTRDPVKACDLRRQMTNMLIAHLRDDHDLESSDQSLCELIIEIQMRVVPRLIATLNSLCASDHPC